MTFSPLLTLAIKKLARCLEKSVRASPRPIDAAAKRLGRLDTAPRMERLKITTLNRDKYNREKFDNLTPDGPAVNRYKPSVKGINLAPATGNYPKSNKSMESFKTTPKRDKNQREKFNNHSSVGPAVNRYKLFVKGINLAPASGSYPKRNKTALTRLKNAMLLEDPSYRTKLEAATITLLHLENCMALVFDNISACRLFEFKFNSIDFINGSNKNL
jgi:hypothetical protein